MPDKQKGSVGKDIAGIIAVLSVLAGLIALMIFLVIKFVMPSLKSDNAEKVRDKKTADVVKEEPRSKTLTKRMRVPPSRRINVKTPTKEKPVVHPKLTESAVSLADDADKVASLMTLQLSGFDVKFLRLDISGIKKDVDLHVPAGMQAEPIAGTNLCTFAVCEPQTIPLKKGSGTNTVYLKAAGMDYRSFRSRVNAVPFVFQPHDKTSAVSRFLNVTAARTSSWHVVQTGLWALGSNPNSKQAGVFTISYRDSQGETKSRPVVSHDDLKQTEGIISSLGLDPDKYLLFGEARAQKTLLIKKINEKKPASDFLRILQSKILTQYKNASEIERILVHYLTRHTDYRVRKSAFENLLETGMTGAPRDLIQRALYGDIDVPFLSAWTSFKQGNEQAYPIIAAFADQSFAKQYCGAAIQAAIKKKSGESRNANETMLAYWIRAIGWDAIPGQAYEKTNIKRAVNLFIPAQNAKRIQALEDIVSGDQSKSRRACSALQKYPYDAIAFQALCRAARNHSSRSIRVHALNSLRPFKHFSPYDTCAHIVDNDEDSVVIAVIDLLSSSQFENHVKVFEKLARHKSSYVRRCMVQKAGRKKIQSAEPILYKLARDDTDTAVKDAALYSLSQLRSKRALKLAKNLITTGNRRTKSSALQSLRAWENNPAALDILDKYRNDPVIGSQIRSHLSRYGR